MTRRFLGGADPERRELVEAGRWRGPGAGIPEPMREYRKTATTFAVRMDEPFEVETLEGLMAGKAGDYLACGVSGELYPIDASVMDASYQEAPPAPSILLSIPVPEGTFDALPDVARADLLSRVATAATLEAERRLHDLGFLS